MKMAAGTWFYTNENGSFVIYQITETGPVKVALTHLEPAASFLTERANEPPRKDTP